MRPVNLIPPEDRRGGSAATRTGALSWILVGVLAAAVLAVGGLTLVDRDLEDKRSELAALEVEEAEVSQRAAELAPYATLAAVKQQRIADLTTLANSRFDWERVMRELSLVLPANVWLTNLTGKVSPEVTIPGAASISLRGSVPGPALELVGCAQGQGGVARLIAALGDIDGVTRVTAAKSARPDSEVAAAASADEEEIREDCRTRDFVTQFELVAAFDAVEVPTATGAEPVPTPDVAPTPPSEGEATPAGEDGGVQEAQQARATGQEETRSAERRARQAANFAPGGGG